MSRFVRLLALLTLFVVPLAGCDDSPTLIVDRFPAMLAEATVATDGIALMRPDGSRLHLNAAAWTCADPSRQCRYDFPMATADSAHPSCHVPEGTSTDHATVVCDIDGGTVTGSMTLVSDGGYRIVLTAGESLSTLTIDGRVSSVGTEGTWTLDASNAACPCTGSGSFSVNR